MLTFRRVKQKFELPDSPGILCWWTADPRLVYEAEVVAQERARPGDTLRDLEMRARRSLEMLDRDKLPYLYGAFLKFYPPGA